MDRKVNSKYFAVTQKYRKNCDINILQNNDNLERYIVRS